MKSARSGGFVMLIVVAVLGAMAVLALNLVQASSQSRALTSSHLDRVHARLGMRSAMHYVINRIQAINTDTDLRWKYFGEDANADGNFNNPVEDTNKNGKLNRFSAPLDEARRCSFPLMNGPSLAPVSINGRLRSTSGSTPSRYGNGSLVFSFKIEKEGERVDLISAQASLPYIDHAYRPHVDSNYGVECRDGPRWTGLNPSLFPPTSIAPPANLTAQIARCIWEGELLDALAADINLSAQDRLPSIVEPVQEYFLRRFTSSYADGGGTGGDGLVSTAEWRAFNNDLTANPNNPFFHPLPINTFHCLGRRRGGPNDIGWLSHRVNAWIEGLRGQRATWTDFILKHPMYSKYIHDATLDPVGTLKGDPNALMPDLEKQKWAWILEEYFTLNRTSGIPCTWAVPEAPSVNGVMTTAPDIPEVQVNYDTAKPFGVMRPDEALGGRKVTLPWISIQEAPLLLLTANFFGIQGVFDPYFMANFEVDRTGANGSTGPLCPLAHNELRSMGQSYHPLKLPEHYWSHMTTDFLAVNSPLPWPSYQPTLPNANYKYVGSTDGKYGKRYGQGIVEISLQEAKAMAAEVVNKRPIKSWAHLKAVLVKALNIYYAATASNLPSSNHNYAGQAPTDGAYSRYQRAEVLAEMAVAAWNPEYISARSIVDGPYPPVSMDRSMLSRHGFPAVLDTPCVFQIECLAILHNDGREMSRSKAFFTLETERWFTHESQKDFEDVPVDWKILNSKVLTHPHNLLGGTSLPSTLDGSITILPVDETVNANLNDACFNAMFNGTLDAQIKIGGSWSNRSPTPGASLHPDGMTTWPSSGIPKGAYPLWTGIEALFPYRSEWSLEFWVKTGFRHQILENLSSNQSGKPFESRVGSEPYIERASPPPDPLGFSYTAPTNYKVAATLAGLYHADPLNCRLLKQAPRTRAFKSTLTNLQSPYEPNLLYGHLCPTPFHAFALPPNTQIVGGATLDTDTEGFAIYPIFGQSTSITPYPLGTYTRDYLFINQMDYSFGAGLKRIDPGEWHHVVFRHVPHDWIVDTPPFVGTNTVATGTAYFDVVMDGADPVRWGVGVPYNPPVDRTLNMFSVLIHDMRPNWPTGLVLDENEWFPRNTAPFIESETWRHFVIPLGEDQLSFWQGFPEVVDIHAGANASINMGQYMNVPSIPGQTWRHPSPGPYTALSYWQNPVNHSFLYPSGGYPGDGGTIEFYAWVYVVQNNLWNDDTYFPWHPAQPNGAGGPPRPATPSKKSTFADGTWPGDSIFDVRQYIWAYVVGWGYDPNKDLDKYFPWHPRLTNPTRGGPPEVAPPTGNEQVWYKRTYFRPEPSPTDLTAAQKQVSLIFAHFSGIDANKMVDNVVIWPGSLGWTNAMDVNGLMNCAHFPQRYAPRGGRTLDDRPTYRNRFKLPGAYREGTVRKIRWDAIHPFRYNGLPLGNKLVAGSKSYSVDVRVFLTDDTGSVLDDPGVAQGWDGSGRAVDVPFTDGHVPYMAVFYNGRLPDWCVDPLLLPVMYEGKIPVCAEAPPAVPAPLNVENISPRLHNVSVLVRPKHPVLRNISLE